ncbi:hypothetical protein E4T56_gene14631 [Termitomyces sp. T112]|nr:hypothetical protein E4T56_gene14631 [Termitomyces sp. T112]
MLARFAPLVLFVLPVLVIGSNLGCPSDTTVMCCRRLVIPVQPDVEVGALLRFTLHDVGRGACRSILDENGLYSCRMIYKPYCCKKIVSISIFHEHGVISSILPY